MPKIIHPLFKEDAQRIKRNWKYLKSNLMQYDIRDNFLVEAIWDLPDFEKIDAEKTPGEKNEMFLKLLLQSGPRAYKVFIAALQENNITHIVEKLKQTPITEDAREPSEFRPMSDVDAHRIKHNWIFLKENLVQHEIRDMFINEDIWDCADFEEIDAEKTPKEKNERFLKLLLQSDHRAYDVFVAALREKCSTHIIEKLQNTRTTKDSKKPAEARLWGPFKELEQTVQAAIHRKIPYAVHDLEIALKKHQPDFIALLKNPPKNAMYRSAVQKASKDGLPVLGDQTRQTFSLAFIEEALLLSDLFDMSEIAAVELLMAAERQQPEFPGLTRGLVAVLLYYDGQKSMINSLRTLLQSREGRMWTMELTPDLSNMVNQYTDQLLQKDRLINTILDQLNNMDLTQEMDRLQKTRAIGPPKHKKQVSDLYKEIQIILADCLFCLATQQPLGKADTLRLIQHLRADNCVSADGSLDPVSLCLLMTLLYCFDVTLLDQEDSKEVLQRLPMMADPTYVTDIHQELRSPQGWSNPGLKSVVMLAWGVTLRQLNQYQTPTGVNGICEEDEVVIDEALDGNVFHFLRTAVVAVSDFHKEEYYLRRVHGLVTDFIFHMPLRVKVLRTRGDEAARIAAAVQNSQEPPTSASHGFQYLMRLIGDLYITDPLGLQLSVEC
uniref:Nuclear pore complex protein Nup205-like isoform X2 n=1 Tax=Crassostrea virginica TaxID=6565 RepID=A0A8B8A8G2_CRAVI|nr:nuclear pore complex protein Nup205-like isoform X2 [Crassostrea virginica]